MQYSQINEALGTIARITSELEYRYIENEGEITAETEALEEQKAAVAELLNGEGVDSLGRWLKAKEDEKATYKAEKAAADRRIKSVDKTIDFIKTTIRQVMDATGTKQAKGAFYSFSALDSRRTSFDAEALDGKWLEAVTEAARAAGLPESVDVALKTTATRLSEDADLADLVTVEESETVKFTKPRAGKEG